MARSRKARVQDVHDIALSMPHVTRYPDTDHAIYQVGSKSFVFFRNPRPDAVDPGTGERYDDVICFWVPSEADKQALVESDGPWFTTPHFDGYRAVLLRGSRIGEVTVDELREVIQDAWLTRASKTRGRQWLAEQSLR